MRGKGRTGLALGLATAIGGVGIFAAVGLFSFVNALPDADAADWSEPQSRPSVEFATPAHAPRPAEPAEHPYLADPGWLAQTAAVTGIPERALAAYAAADLRVADELGCAVGWNTLAGIGWVESYHGTIHGSAIDADGVARPSIVGIPLDGTNGTMAIPDTDGGELDGDTEWDRAVGPMQFIPETWYLWGADATGDGHASPHSIDDAALTAAHYLCRLDGTLETENAWIAAIRSYNNTLEYQQRVASAAERYAEDATAVGS
ncbi:hypothetical protein GCM10011490_27460 [Pseudoclavibacter endophyticus]|nr:lytic murein transglycosylase [Pseudoclavibacter endophyticus]GGA75199.1 hypothetical protein GCM10011490_27460 [Pseudoclavibacter endophyticus]